MTAAMTPIANPHTLHCGGIGIVGIADSPGRRRPNAATANQPNIP